MNLKNKEKRFARDEIILSNFYKTIVQRMLKLKKEKLKKD